MSGTCSKRPSKSVSTSTVVVSPDHLSPTLSTSSTIKTPSKTEEDPDDPDPADEGDIQVEYSSHYLYSPSTGAVTKMTQKNLSQYA